ncbi:MAG: hypothetical protein KDA41_21890 [Planctomycetales bacterium]|nr:hypothetical protein [Planctomycetales bacterium]
MVAGLARRQAAAIVEARQQQPFASMADFARRTGVGQAAVARLAKADAFSSLGRRRREALWESLAQEKSTRPMPLLAGLDEQDEPLPLSLPTMDLEEEVFADYGATGLSLKAHPVSFYRTALAQCGVVPAKQLLKTAHNARVCVAGIVLLRQRPSTAKGITFVTIEDETGTANLVVHQNTWERFYAVARRSAGFFVQGRLERKDAVVHVIVERLEDLSARLREMKPLTAASRDFR